MALSANTVTCLPRRSALAKTIGLGRKGIEAAAPANDAGKKTRRKNAKAA